MNQDESAAIALAEKILDYNGNKVWAVQAALHSKVRARQSLNARMLLKVCRKCILDGFPLEKYILHEVPFDDEDEVIMDFVNKSDFDTYYEEEDGESKIKEIDFSCSKDIKEKMATPLKMDEEGNQEDCDNCFKCVYMENSDGDITAVYPEPPQAETSL